MTATDIYIISSYNYDIETPQKRKIEIRVSKERDKSDR